MANLVLYKASKLVIAASLGILISACAKENSVPKPTAFIPAEEPLLGGATGEYEVDSPSVLVNSADINPNAPSAYTVRSGDTLWDISGRFLNSAWKWPEVWDYNPQIKDPHLIYPGDQLFLSYVGGQPTLSLIRNGQSTGTGLGDLGSNFNATRVSPRVRSESLSEAIPTIPGDAIKQFLVRPNVVTSAQLSNAPYVVGNEEGRLISSIGQQIFVRGDVDHSKPKFGIYRKTETLKDPKTGALLGYEVIHVAEAKLLNVGDPSTMVITSMPPLEGEGSIVSLVDAISQTSRDQIVVVNLGKNIGVKVGDVLAIESRGKSILDRHGKRSAERITTPNKRTGVMMIFQTFDNVSYGLVMESSRPVKKNDVITAI